MGHNLYRILRVSALFVVALMILVLLFIYMFIPGFIAVAGILGV